ncbi:MAG TPA: glucose sorbosone dehydrogenase, partial [Eubacteriaceae bacterium]|nr:glucose sorbosone dehydrogenase [Eubacteriaceae bacterium]
MNKKWIIMLLVFILVLIVFWQVVLDDGEGERQNSNEESADEPDHQQEQEDLLYSTEDMDYEIEVIGEDLEIPWSIAPLPDGRLLVTERPGRVILLDGGEVRVLRDVEHVGEGGLLGIVTSPDFEQNRQVFLYYTYAAENQLFNRVSRFTLEENTLTDETTILDEIPGSQFHNGGRLKFGPDQKLYVTTGDAQQPERSQDTSSLSGKILRINPDGSIPEDNPFEDSPVYAYGLRNPQGMAWHPVSGDLFASDHGPNSQDEINLIVPGENYGWPIETCSEENPQYQEPLACYTDFTLAPSGMDFLPWERLDETPLYVAGLRGNRVMRVD